MSNTADKELAIYKTAADMAQSGSSSSEIKSTLLEMGVTENEADTIVQQVTQYHTQYKQEASSSGIVSGILFLIGGIVATAATDGHVLFYGAIIVGIIKIIVGIARN